MLHVRILSSDFFSHEKERLIGRAVKTIFLRVFFLKLSLGTSVLMILSRVFYYSPVF